MQSGLQLLLWNVGGGAQFDAREALNPHPCIMQFKIPMLSIAKSLYYMTMHFDDMYEGSFEIKLVILVLSASATESHHDPILWLLVGSFYQSEGPDEMNLLENDVLICIQL